ncbi:PH domain-containing protein [Candidatus Woesebacteria bacterium]|nr:PH domain-containing protein [Candidatus Woesebacteria bacterium]
MNHQYTINLLEDEKILWEGKPVPALQSYLYWSFVLLWVFVLLFTLVGIVLIPFVFILGIPYAQAVYEKRYYWVTNKRIVYRRGFLGYKISSLPLNRVSDVIISRTFFENMFGFGSLQIQTLAGQISTGAGGSEGDLRAVDEPEKLQQLILEQLKHNK